jgi:hypothetical protein
MVGRKAAQEDESAALETRSNREDTLPRRTAASQTATGATRLSRGLVDAPGKHHRKPLTQEPIDKQMGEPRGKQTGQKSAKAGWRGGRGKPDVPGILPRGFEPDLQRALSPSAPLREETVRAPPGWRICRMAEHLSAGVEELVDQVLFDADVARQHVRDKTESARARMLVM